jgi:HdeA/HdeB family
MRKLIRPTLLLLCLAACAEPAPPPTAPPQATAAPLPSPASEGQIGPHLWDVELVRCSDLLGASDADRASAAMFYYGYLAAKAGIRVIDVSRISGNIARVMQQCEAQPDLTVPEAFREALRPQPGPG